MRLHQALNAAAAELSHQEPVRPEDRQLICEAMAHLAGELAPAFAADLTGERLAKYAVLMSAGVIRPAEPVAAALAAATEGRYSLACLGPQVRAWIEHAE